MIRFRYQRRSFWIPECLTLQVQKISQTYSSLSGAFSPYDEVSLYTYSSTVSQVSDFSATGQKLTVGTEPDEDWSAAETTARR